jgi:hypothetical protein
MKVGEFQNAISTNSKAYSNFMTQNGSSKGFGSSVYQKAWRFFKLRELRGIKPPKQPSKPKKGKEGAAAAAAAPDLTAIELPGEMDDKVAVYGKPFPCKRGYGGARTKKLIQHRHVRRRPPQD